MNATDDNDHAAGGPADGACVRTNLAAAEIIEKGIALQEDRGTRYAAEFFRTRMINMELAARVLLRQAERRNRRDGDG